MEKHVSGDYRQYASVFPQTKAKNNSQAKSGTKAKDAQRKQVTYKEATVSTEKEVDPVEVCRAKNLPISTFMQYNERLQKPIVIQDLCKNWEGFTKGSFTFQQLVMRFGKSRLKVLNEISLPAGTELRLKEYADYISVSGDQLPICVGDHALLKILIKEYSVPSYFRDDLFRYVQNSKNMLDNLRQIQIVPKYGGYYCDSFGGNLMSWTACCDGVLRFALFPSHIDFHQLTTKYSGSGMRHPREWFCNTLAKIKQNEGKHMWPLEGALKPGDILFRPVGWKMICLGIASPASVLIVHKYVSPTNFENVWQLVELQRPSLTKAWTTALRKNRPELLSMVKARRVVSSSSSSSSSDSSSSTSSSCSGTCAKTTTSYSSEYFDTSDNS